MKFFAQLRDMPDFSTIQAEDIKTTAQSAISQTRDKLKKITEEPLPTYENTLQAMDSVYDSFEQIFSIAALIAYVHPEAAVRNEALQQLPELEKFLNELALDEPLYLALKRYAGTAEAKALTGYKRKFLDESLEDFERNGLNLPKDKREELLAVLDKQAEAGVAFDNNIASYEDALIVDEEEARGMPEDYLKARQTEDGKYKIDLSYPSFRPFMKYAHSAQARKALMQKFLNRAAEQNLPVLDTILELRNKQAALLGYATYADYKIADKMAKTATAVRDFEEDLAEKVRPKALKDYQELLALKRELLQDDSVSQVQSYEAAYLTDQLLKRKYEVDQEKVKAYFPLNQVIDGLFTICGELFGVRFEEDNLPQTWHPDVRAFRMYRDGELAGHFYLDLFPRPNKFKHAASFPLRYGRQAPAGYQLPAATLITNFPPPTEEGPSLLPHEEVVTLFHEFGHLMHDLLTRSPLSSFAGTKVSRDFVETPSQLFENWAWEYESLKRFARHHQSGEPLPKSLHEKMRAARNVGSGTATLQQIFYGMLDMTYHSGYSPKGGQSTTDILKSLQEKFTMYDYLEGTHFQASFGHLNGYAAGYYGYLWAKVYAEDIFSAFRKKGILDHTTGRNLRDGLLAKGKTEDEYQLVKNFLGREPKPEAFLQSLGLEIDEKP